MKSNSDLQVVRRLADSEIHDAFHLDRVRYDLARLATAPNCVADRAERARIRFRKAGSAPFWGIGRRSTRRQTDSFPQERTWSAERASICNWRASTRSRRWRKAAALPSCKRTSKNKTSVASGPPTSGNT